MPKLTLRDLFAAVTIVAILVAWWADRTRLRRTIDEIYRHNDVIPHVDFYVGPKGP
jgi:hypothetical protein